MPSGRDETTQSSPPSDHDGNVQAGETEQARERVASASAARATASPSPPSLLQQWTDLLGSPQDWLLPPSCSGCLTQVVDDDNGNGDGAVESASQVDTTSSSLDRDETPARDSSSSRLNLSPDTDSTDANLSASYRSGKLKSASRSTTIPHPHCEDEGDELSTNQNCPICLNTMSRSDIIYPITCPTSCNYNFCVDCMSSLLRSSREDYQVASDGSRQVKIRLQCPNCRAGIADIIEDVISLRQEALAADIELSDKKMPASSTVPSTLSTSHGSKLKNRSSAPRHVHQLRINDLIEKIQSMPTPSSVRDQVLAVHGRRVERQGSFSSASLIDDTLSRCSSLSSVEVQTVQPLSSTISSPIYTRSSSLEPPGPPSRAHSLDLLASPQVNRLVTPSPIRRTKSFQTPPSSPQHEQKSPRSILDFTYSYNEDALEQKKKSGLTQAHSPRPHGERTEGSKVCLEGINFTEGEGGYFSNAIDLDWCCYDITSNDHTSSFQKEDPSTKIKGSEDCGGYVDYGGTYHPCSDVAQLDGRNQAIEWEGPCQGCIFRRGMHDGSESDEEEEELYYDSDPGQHFAIGGSWSKELPPASSCGNLDITGRESNRQLSASPPTTPQRAKSRWRRRRKRQGKKLRSRGSAASFTSSQASSHAKDACSAYLEVVQQRKEEEDLRQRHDDQQAHLYDYFSRNDDAVNSMRTGFYSTRETDVGSYVQVSTVDEAAYVSCPFKCVVF